MSIYLAVDSSLSMRLPVYGNSETSRQMIACQLVLQTIEKVRSLNADKKIKLIDFSHNSKLILSDARNVEEAAKKLNSVSISASADLISLFLLIKMQNDYDISTLFVFTDACSFTPEEINLTHLPNCAVKFVSVLDESWTDPDQIARLWAISLQTQGFEQAFELEDSEPWMPYFMSDYDSIDSYSDALAKDLCPEPIFELQCGFLEEAYFKVIPSVDDDNWNQVIEVIGFIPVNGLANLPTAQHHFVIGLEGSVDTLNLFCAALRAEESVAICHISGSLYGALAPICAKEEDPAACRLSFALFPASPEPVPWLSPFTKMSCQSVVDSGKEDPVFCVPNDGLSKPSYSSLQRTCWYETHGLQSDIQKTARLLKKIPERTFMFYSELNRIHMYCCAIGAEDVLEKLIQVLHDEGSTHTPLVSKHTTYVNEKLRMLGLKSSTEIQPLQ